MVLQRQGWPNTVFLRSERGSLLLLVSVSLIGAAPGEGEAQHLEQLRYEEVARVGDFGSGTEFGRIADIVVDASGSIWVADRMNNTIVILDSLLQPMRMVGRRGGGPGEFRSLVRLDAVGDTVTAFDAGLSRLSLFDRSGAFIRSHSETRGPLSDSGDVSYRPAEAMLGSGLLLQVALRGGGGESRRTAVLVSYDPEREARSPLARIRLDRKVTQVRFGSNGYTFAPRPVISSDLYAVSPAGGSVVVINQMLPQTSDSAVASVRTVANNGDTISSIRLSVPARPIDPGLAREELRHSAESFASTLASRSGHGRQEAFKLYMDAMDIPLHQVPFDRLVLSRSGEIYLREGAFGLEHARWLVLDPREKTHGHFYLPANVDVMAVHGHRLVGRTLGTYEESVLTIWTRR